MKTATLNIRIDPETKQQAEAIYQSFGITLTDAVNIFLRQSINMGGLPFEMRRPRYNAATEAAMQEARSIASGGTQSKQYDSFDDYLAEVKAEMAGEDNA